MKITSHKVTIINFNVMSIFNFDSFHGLFISRNIRERQAKIALELKEKNPDIITLQEVHTYSILNLYKKRLNYPYAAYKKFIIGPRGGLVTFSKIPIEGVAYINFKKRGTFLNSSFIARIIRNGVLLCRLKDFELTVLNTHATPNLDHDDSKNNRFVKFINAQLTQISELIKSISDNNQRIIIGGDFNVAKGSYTYKKFIETSGITDVFSKYNSPTQHQEFLPRGKTVKRIDYIFAKSLEGKPVAKFVEHLFTKKFLLKKKSVQYLSDHIGLHAEIEI